MQLPLYSNVILITMFVFIRYYYNDQRPLLKISFFCEEEDAGEIICRYIVQDNILFKTKNELNSCTLLGPTIEIFSNGMPETTKVCMIFFWLRDT